jgi:hypothetical protein
VIRVARTIANLAHEEKIRQSHMAEAIQYRPRREHCNGRAGAEKVAASQEAACLLD